MSAPTMPPPAPVATTAPLGAQRTSRHYYDDQGRRRTANVAVPVDQYGAINGAQFRCRRCRITEWFPKGLRGAPVCGRCEHRMDLHEVEDAPVLPWRDIVDAAQRPLRPVWALGAVGAVGVAGAVGGVPWGVPFAAAVPVGVLVSAVARRRFAARSRRLDRDDPGGQPQLRAAIDAAARRCGYVAAATTGWFAVPAAVGVPVGGVVGHLATWGSLIAAWAVPAGAWWRGERARRNRPAPEVRVEVDDTPVVDVDPDEAAVLRVWSTVVAAKQGQVVDADPRGGPVVAARTGKLVGTWLEEWHRVTGGWSAVIVGDPGAFTAQSFLDARAHIASAFQMKTSMITIIPDPDDENRALVLAQRSSPIKETVRWTGPDSIDVTRGTAPVQRYADGEYAMYELWRPGWGCPHDGIFGTTGSGKSELINLLFTISRWAHRRDENNTPVGLVADFLIDPQQGQSFGPFLDDLAAPVAASLEEAQLLARVLTAEMLRRNRYLAREAKVWDEKRGKWRTGRKWWDPMLDGPLLFLTIDEAHLYLMDREFAALIIAAGRMWRKCGGKLRVATHTPLLTDLGGSTALRDMLTGGFVWVGRTANSLSGPTAFNGRLPVDPRTIPADPGMAYALTGPQPKAMLGRAMWEPDFYDWVRDANDQPIGYPAELPSLTRATFDGASKGGYAKWVAAAASGDLWTPEADVKPAEPKADKNSVDAVLDVLGGMADQWVDMDTIDKALAAGGRSYSTRTVRDALLTLRKNDPPLVETRDRRHQLTQAGLEQALGAV